MTSSICTPWFFFFSKSFPTLFGSTRFLLVHETTIYALFIIEYIDNGNIYIYIYTALSSSSSSVSPHVMSYSVIFHLVSRINQQSLPPEIRFMEGALGLNTTTDVRKFALQKFCPNEGMSPEELRLRIRSLLCSMDQLPRKSYHQLEVGVGVGVVIVMIRCCCYWENQLLLFIVSGRPCPSLDEDYKIIIA